MKPETKAWIAFAFVSIAWGTTYLAIKIGVETWPPFFFAAVRQVVAGVLLLGLALAFGKLKGDFSRANLLKNLIVGVLMITLGNGIVSWAEKYVPSGVASLICSMMPIAAVLINLAGRSKEKINWIIVVGMCLGISGVLLIFLSNHHNEAKSTNYVLGIVALIIATTCWAWGSLVNKRNPPAGNPIANAGMQLLFGGLALGLMSVFADDFHEVNYINAKALWSLVYLVIVGSILAYTAFMFALRVLPSGIVLSYAYINPFVAVILGMLYGEGGGWYIVGSFVLILLGVYLVKRGYSFEEKKGNAKLMANGNTLIDPEQPTKILP